MLSDLIDRLFNRSSPKSRSEVKRRLQKLLAHDRTTLSPKELEDIQREIMEVVSRYVELDQEGLEFVLASDQRLTSLVANLPIRRIKGESKDDAAKRVVDMPQDEPGDEQVPENMTLDEAESGERAILRSLAEPIANSSTKKMDAPKRWAPSK
ncbi:MAG: cell division topological specificity factor MinE [Synechococcales cyanobacterium RU_4_20]|nr:cell division topological specificity factor MinE [Synechococcales cyanobacterium RU_4_20]NJR69179.1 cell division topological specificity factor MinE [Synechococcales cyanobacterium CRU_2_2]